MFVSTDIHRFVCDTMITTGQEPKSVLTRKKRFLFPHERPGCECKKGETGSRQTDVWGFPAKTQLDFFAKDGRARARKSKERGEGISLREKSTGKKKNRRSVGKRNYRLMRRSFRHVDFERESAIGRCFFTEVIRVSAHSLSFLSSLFLSFARLLQCYLFHSCPTRAFMIYPPSDVYWKAC